MSRGTRIWRSVMSDGHITQKNAFKIHGSLPLYKLKDIPVWANSRRQTCRDTFCFCCSNVTYRSGRNGRLLSLSSCMVTSTFKAVVSSLSRITFPKLSLFSKWIWSSCQAQEHYRLMTFEIQMGEKFVSVLGKINPSSPKELVNALQACSANLPSLRCTGT